LSDEVKFETIFRTSDPVTGEMLEDVLRTEGFDARLQLAFGLAEVALVGALALLVIGLVE
jgi:hypothetical protein